MAVEALALVTLALGPRTAAPALRTVEAGLAALDNLRGLLTVAPALRTGEGGLAVTHEPKIAALRTVEAVAERLGPCAINYAQLASQNLEDGVWANDTC